jgi:hypothetical protein
MGAGPSSETMDSDFFLEPIVFIVPIVANFLFLPASSDIHAGKDPCVF